ncbi:hypothetical protein A3D84_00495 [Candidatus Woesebacteria bacterium RIFCSPHIGHO2_02_FULL_42_20]|uniref:Uncharacterized protein n=1 Tax=Candidatus Woesebacteria bacterium RIFCSPHIGHO2_12_FULL_41_24 TaxID=1802510 RepID=A0A1F8ATT4_9BACT|nr:MAG: hypothetical protein A2W15_02000 [Candidatus Woesebacteria bacterium RBG_16_41_13]OGM29730.1 MAG: hypothetical protein A2873_02420 [Candidatus Woesebacteria bacterium RIFCSPHIGHO2_01_FULL_42_80]OGM35257.1 MAG: hypothetical protein A3D84_00495 [Candidatus Woesebacteria bacterium RIFCSPHIGHO2_02_FULL_42_20]OGM55152.1 MAG: hypothetical protein A3E44_04505 [Candidatus Woesebacteria bacterium RIFCSPHIGHO2_12_FULL_41_24]OGM67724.1 MAG: hypothetical protein A2969_02210 [Candidatus Woesebacteri
MKTLQVIAQGINVGQPLNGVGKLADPGQNAGSVFNSVLSLIIGIVTVVISIAFLFIVISSAIKLITSGEDKAAVESARKKVLIGFFGLILLISGVFIIGFIGEILGLDVLNPTRILENIWQP